MIKKLLALLISSLLLTSLNCYASSNASVNSKYPNHIYLGPEAFAFDLHTNVKDVKINGVRYFVGYRLRYEYLKPKAFYAGVDLLGSWGNKRFKASSPGYNFHTHGANGFGNIELRLGYTFAPKSGIFTPFLGTGFFVVGNTASSELLVYFATGMRSLFELSPLFSLGVNFKVLFAPQAERIFKYRYQGHKTRLKEYENMWGSEIGVPFVWRLGSSRRWEIQLEPYFLNLSFSEVQNVYGTRLLFGYRF